MKFVFCWCCLWNFFPFFARLQKHFLGLLAHSHSDVVCMCVRVIPFRLYFMYFTSYEHYSFADISWLLLFSLCTYIVRSKGEEDEDRYNTQQKKENDSDTYIENHSNQRNPSEVTTICLDRTRIWNNKSNANNRNYKRKLKIISRNCGMSVIQSVYVCAHILSFFVNVQHQRGH